MYNNIDVIILANSKSMDMYGMTQRTINTLRWSEDGKRFNINVIESNKQLYDEGYVYHNCNVIMPPEPFGYNSYLNEGLKHCTKDWVIVANNDLIFTKNWLNKMFEFQRQHPDVLSLSPWEPNWHVKRGMDATKDYFFGYRTSFEITGWCFVIHKSVIEQCKLFDPAFKFWYQDNDYALTLQKHNLKHALVVKSRVYHMVSGSHHLLTDESRHNMTDGQLNVLKEKWGNV